MQLALNPLKFEDIKAQIIQYLTENSDYAGQFDFTNANISYFIDTMTYITMLMSYNTSHMANNMFLDTTEIRKNAVSIAKQLGYKPKRPYSAKIRGKLIYKGTNFTKNDKIVVKARAPFVGSFGNIYQSMTPIVLEYKGNPTQLEGDYIIAEGVFQQFTTNGTGKSNQSFIINDKKIEEENFSLYVAPNSTSDLNSAAIAGYKWENALPFLIPDNGKMLDANQIYFLEEDIVSEGALKVVFGNGVIGKIPSESETIICEYLQTKGADANNETLVSLPPADKIGTTTIYYDTTQLTGTFSLSNFDATVYQNQYNKSFGGTALESLESIKYNAPKFYSFAGRCVSKNDYLYYLSSLPEVKAVNVIGGDTLFPSDVTKLGNIYISIVPNINISEFINGEGIYLNSASENDIKYKLENVSILSTKRHFYKPSYIMIDVTPTIEFPVNIGTTERNTIIKQLNTLLNNYFLTKFNTLGVPFRQSKASAVIDNVASITSSDLGLKFYFILNDKTVENLVKGVNDFIYLPTLDVKDVNGVKVSTKNFVKTNQDVVKEEVYADIDWTILNQDKTLLNESQVLEYKSKLMLMNSALLNIVPSTASISGKLILPSTLQRYLYNRDFSDTKIAALKFNSASEIKTTGSSFIDRFGLTIASNVVTVGNVKYLQFNGVDVGRVLTSSISGVNDVYVEVDTAHEVALLEQFNIDNTSYVFDQSPFKVVKIDNTNFEIQMRVVKSTSELAIYGKNVLGNVVRVNPTFNGQEQLIIDDKTVLDGWSLTHAAGNTFGTLSYTGIPDAPVAVVERSHMGVTPATHFKGFINSKTEYDNIVTNVSNLSNGDYYIIVTNFYTSDFVPFNEGDILYKNTTLQKASVKRITDASKASNLITTYKNGDLFIYNGNPSVYDLESGSLVTVAVQTNKYLDASQALPAPLTHGTVKRAVVTNDSLVDTPVHIYYADGSNKKVSNLKLITSGGGTTLNHTGDVYDGDVMVYNSNDSYWYVVENVKPEHTNANARLQVRSIEIDNIDTIDTDAPYFGKVYTLSSAVSSIDIASSDLFVNSPPDNRLYSGDMLICINPTGGTQWVIFNDDYYDFQQDITDTAACSSFPEIINKGYVFPVKVSGTTVTNFGGMTQTVSFADGDQILYYGVDSTTNQPLWKKYSAVGLPTFNDNDPQAAIGDLIVINKTGGNFENSALVVCPEYSTNLRLFSYNDILYYTGTSWIKANPYNIYVNPSHDKFRGADNTADFRVRLNEAGYNSDFIIKNYSNNTFDVILKDKYHDTIVADFDYQSGKVTFKPTITASLDKLTSVTGVVGDIFNSANYVNSGKRMDKILLKPVTAANGKVETDIDTNFNQFLIFNVMDVKTV